MDYNKFQIQISYLWEVQWQELVNDGIVQTCPFIQQHSLHIVNEVITVDQHCYILPVDMLQCLENTALSP